MSENTSITFWTDQKQLTEIKRLFAPTLTETEFSIFTGLGKALDLNPFTREIWAVKYGTSASIFVGRDGYRKNAQKNPQYDWHLAEAVYENDQFKITPEGVQHEFNLTNRGALVGAYALCKRKDSSRPNYGYVSLKEYNKGQSVWKTMPETMIKKTAEAQILRGTFQDLFAGTYDEVEQGVITGQKGIEQDEVESINKEIDGLLDLCTSHAKYLANRDKLKSLIEKLPQGLQAEYFNKITNIIAAHKKKEEVKKEKTEKKEQEQPKFAEEDKIKESEVQQIFPQQ